ncbi:putative phosphoribosyltransferase [Dehalogenimonas alkenigignens]|uniref:Putative phosphoribosyltransferase n=1 Tax=Dehalogenimonas alkenigignens TaxID=1217799 RepID=A0A0W0GJP5_9CHLR|nr:phosphoribosyltransferase family protein [Dehalogenimonas alkenigignens]KTB48793.1 putative phosphoribosyltransferase [Dehalogenimonas alkenigignens]
MGQIRVISRSAAPFVDRQEAGRLLADSMSHLMDTHAVVLGIPRGGVAVAAELARRLRAELDIVLSRKLRAPGQPELAMGAVSEDGHVLLNKDVVEALDIKPDTIERERTFQLSEIERRGRLFRGTRKRVPLKGRIVIVTDDGVATGATFRSALDACRHESPSRLIAALPVAPEGAIQDIAAAADELICLRVPPFFNAVGQFYVRFEQLEDDDVIKLLQLSTP